MTTRAEGGREGRLAREYMGRVTSLMERILDEEDEPLRRAALAVADAVAEDRLVYVFGPGGHSAMSSEEVFFRAGGLVAVSPLLDTGVMLVGGAVRSTAIERTPGYAKAVLDDFGVGDGDLLVIVNAYGINACTIDAALLSKERGTRTIAVTSRSLQAELPQGHPSRHPSGKNLADIADIVVDCKVPMGDALLTVPGVRQAVGPSSSYLNALALNLIMLGAVEELARRGIDPAIWQSANSPGGDEANAAHVERYRGRVKRL